MAILKNRFVSFAGIRYPLRKSKYTENASPLHVSDDMSGKLSGIPSISTSCRVNPHCLARIASGKAGHVCHACFAKDTLGRYDDAERATEGNFVLLNSGLLPDEWIPRFSNVSIVRVESFGDLYSVTQARNYLRIVKANPRVTFAWWTKNGGLLDRALKIEGRPRNVVFIQSSEFIDRAASPRWYWVDHVFTVYQSEKSAAAHGVKINCGARRCATCRRCYTRRGALHVSELLK